MAKQVDKTYANALFELAIEENKIDVFFEEVVVLIDVLKANRELIKLLSNPQVSKEEKEQIVKETFDGRTSNEIAGLIYMLIEKNHAINILDVFEVFVKLVKKEKNIGLVSITSAVLLDDNQKKAIERKLIETTVFDTLEVDYKIDEAIIGGLVIRIDDRVVDSSIKTKLEALSKNLLKV